MVVDGVGVLRDVEMTLDNIERLVGGNFVLSELNLERALIDSTVCTYYDCKGKETEHIKDAELKIIEITGLKVHDGGPVCISFVKFSDRAKKYGDASEEAWGGVSVGREDFLYSKWIQKNGIKLEEYGTQQPKKEIGPDSPFYKVQQMIESGELLCSDDNSDDKTVIKSEDRAPNICKDSFLDEVYDLLYLKESWQKPDGDMIRLACYFKHLATKITHDNQMSKYMRFNKKKDRAVLNSRLLNKYGNYIVVSCKFSTDELSDFQLIRGVEDLKSMGFDSEAIEVPPISFFEHLNDVVFKGTMDDFELYNIRHLSHIIEERKHRLPMDMRDKSPIDISMRLMASIEMAVKIAQTDYKFIVPMYSEERRRVQFLIPVYSSFDGVSRPECALVVDKNDIGKWEIKTVLDLELAYSDARLINRPDQNWLSLE